MLILLIGFAAILLAFATWEVFAPRQIAPKIAPKIAHWRLKCLAAIALHFAISFGSPLLWHAAIAQYTLFDASALPVSLQILGGFLAYELGVHWWHRTMHSIDPLWRHFHKTHRSAERLDFWGAFWFHPLDVAGFTLVGSLALVGGFGVSLEAAIAVNLFALFCNMFLHANTKTPGWPGNIIQRPESHAVHHWRGVHRFN